MDAAVRLNPKLKLSPKYQLSAIHAITRLDLSSNDLSEVPDVIFQMQSLKILCLAQNKIETLPPPQFKRSGGVKELFYQCPALEEVQLQVNNEYIYPQVVKFLLWACTISLKSIPYFLELYLLVNYFFL